MYGNSTRLTRKPGVPATGTGNLPKRLAECGEPALGLRAMPSWWMISTSGICATGLK
jgi:hypothetical protein